MEEVMHEPGLREWAEYQQSVIQVRGGVFQEGAVGDGAGRRSGSKTAGLQRQRKGATPYFDTQWVPSRSPITGVTI